MDAANAGRCGAQAILESDANMVILREPPSALEFAEMYEEAGWIENPNFERMELAINHTSEWFVSRKKDGSLRGIGRIITDYIRYAFMVDVIVKESEQGKGVGSDLMRAILAKCASLSIDSINLWPSEGKVSFYERFGFYALPPGQPHMKLKK